MEVTFYSSSYSSILNILDCEKKKKKKTLHNQESQCRIDIGRKKNFSITSHPLNTSLHK